MRTEELEAHLEAHWEKIRSKLLAGTYVLTPVKRVEIPKPSGGVRKWGIPTVLDRFIQQLLWQVMTPVFEPWFSEHSYGFRAGRSAHDAVAAAQRYAEQGQDWAVDLNTAQLFDPVNHDLLMGGIAQVIRDTRGVRLRGRYLRRGAWFMAATSTMHSGLSRPCRGGMGFQCHRTLRPAVRAAAINRRMRKTARPVVREGGRAQSRSPDPIMTGLEAYPTGPGLRWPWRAVRTAAPVS